MPRTVCAGLWCMGLGKRRKNFGNEHIASGIRPKGSKIDAPVSCQGAKRQKLSLGYAAKWSKAKTIGLLSITYFKGSRNILGGKNVWKVDTS